MTLHAAHYIFCILWCVSYENQKSPLSFNQIPKKARKIIKDKRNRCSQYWISHWTRGPRASEGNVIKHRQVRSYLRIENEVKINYYLYYSKKKDIYSLEQEDTKEDDVVQSSIKRHKHIFFEENHDT